MRAYIPIILILFVFTGSTALSYEVSKPESHDASWTQIHGEAANADLSSCLECHEDRQGCIECHEDVVPRNHNGSWKRKLHGIKAQWDRASCLVCHQEDSCVECHKVSTPFSHRPGWGGLDDTQNRHCGSCHYPVQETNCFTCHETAHAPNSF